eukprot:956538-Amorphochlora_amoeboformis.AAC.1
MPICSIAIRLDPEGGRTCGTQPKADCRPFRSTVSSTGNRMMMIAARAGRIGEGRHADINYINPA